MTFTNQSRTSSSWSNGSRSSSTFAGQAKSDAIILDNDVLSNLESVAFSDAYEGVVLDDRRFNDNLSSTRWTNQTRS